MIFSAILLLRTAECYILYCKEQYSDLQNLFILYSVRTPFIVSHGLYIFFHCGLYCRGVDIKENLYTKQEKSSIYAMRTLELLQHLLPHLNFGIFWGFPLCNVVSWRGLL